MNTIHSAHIHIMSNSKVGLRKAGAIADSLRGTTYLAEIAYRVTGLLYLFKPHFVSEIYINILFNTLTILSGAEVLRLKEKQFKKESLLTEKIEKGILTIKTLVDFVRGAGALKLINLGNLSLKMGKIACLPISLMFTPLGVISELLQFLSDLHGLGTVVVKLTLNRNAIKHLASCSQGEELKKLKKVKTHLIVQLSFKITRIATATLGLCLIIIAPQVGILIFPFLVLGAIAYSIRLFEFACEGIK